MDRFIKLRTPATRYFDGLPIGNGVLAAMVAGTMPESLVLNREDLYDGENTDRDVEAVPREQLEKVRELLRNEKFGEGTYLANKLFAGPGGMSAEKDREQPYQPAATLHIQEGCAGEIRNYERSLDLEDALAQVSFVKDGVCYKRQFAADYGDTKLLFVRLSASAKTDYTFSFSRPEDAKCVTSAQCDANGFSAFGKFQGKSAYGVFVRVCDTDGAQDGFTVRGATRIDLLIDIIATDGDIPRKSEKLANAAFSALWGTRSQNYRALFDKCAVQLEGVSNDNAMEDRIAAYRNGASDPSLPILYFDYGRYLLISSTGVLPPNLQGKWNDMISPPWESDFHTDINLEMNYWPAEVSGLSCLMDALFNWIDLFIPHAREVAQKFYGCRGFVLPIQTDATGRATPESFGWAAWLGAAPWLAEFYMRRYEYSLDMDFLRGRAYPYIKEVCAFIEDYVTEEKDGKLSIVPSMSPENTIAYPDDAFMRLPVTMCVSSTMDVSLFRRCLTYGITCAKLLDTDSECVAKWQSILDRLPEIPIGSKGQIVEWSKEYPEAEPAHRHLSHLVTVFPSGFINRYDTPRLFAAAEKSLDLRHMNGGTHIGWSHAWASCLYACFHDAEKSYAHLQGLLREFASLSLLDLIDGEKVFQIDGNFGGAAAVTEMLLQCYGDIIEVLPALPDEWRTGSFRELRARGGFRVSCAWENHAAKTITVVSDAGSLCRIALAKKPDGIIGDYADGIFTFMTEKGKTYRIEL